MQWDRSLLLPPCWFGFLDFLPLTQLPPIRGCCFSSPPFLKTRVTNEHMGSASDALTFREVLESRKPSGLIGEA